MGITFLAAGSSVPDALSSVLVVRQGTSWMSIKWFENLDFFRSCGYGCIKYIWFECVWFIGWTCITMVF
jgi:hypothetical protein